MRGRRGRRAVAVHPLHAPAGRHRDRELLAGVRDLDHVVVMFGKRDDIEGNAVVRRLDAVREDRTIYLDLTDQFAGALGFSSALSLAYLVDEAPDELAAAVDGDPGTPVRQPR
jgi:hypothetical protein